MRSLELFSGAGGLAKGLELAGFEHAALVEMNKHACASLVENFQPVKVFGEDVKDFNLKHVGPVDIVAGGPPCQPFSLGGKHQAEQDHRDLFPYAIRAIEILLPKAFIFENVKGLLRPSFSDYFEYLILRLTYPDFIAKQPLEWRAHLEQLRKLNPLTYTGVKYDIQYELINAADYGVPQTRDRVFIIGTRSDLKLQWNFPQKTHSEERLLWNMYISEEYWQQNYIKSERRPEVAASTLEKVTRIKDRYGFFEPELLPWRTIRDALYDVPDPRHHHNISDHIFRDGARSYPGHTGSDYDWPSKTIKAGGHGVPGGENMIRYADGSIRYLTVFEAKRIQTFPDNFVVKGAWSEAMRQLGNAVPVKLGELLGVHLRQMIERQMTTSKTLANR